MIFFWKKNGLFVVSFSWNNFVCSVTFYRLFELVRFRRHSISSLPERGKLIFVMARPWKFPLDSRNPRSKLCRRIFPFSRISNTHFPDWKCPRRTRAAITNTVTRVTLSTMEKHRFETGTRCHSRFSQVNNFNIDRNIPTIYYRYLRFSAAKKIQ